MRIVEYPFKKGKLTNSVIYGQVKEIELLKKDYFSIIVESDSVINEEYYGVHYAAYYCKLKRTSNKLHPLFDSVAVGNRIKIEGTIRKGRERRNPFEFDYNAYLTSTGINALLYVKRIKDIEITDNSSSAMSNSVYLIRK
jgi:hypothetical protein